MISKIKRTLRGRVGPVGLSLIAAALTAVAFAAVSVAKDESGSKGNQDQAGAARQAGPGGPPPMELNLSDEDKQKLEDFRQCMSDQGVEPPPRPDGDQDGTFKRQIKPPSEAQREKMDKAFEACKDNLPEDAQGMGRGGPCGPPPGPPPGQQGPGSNQDQGYAIPAPQGATS